MYRIVKREQETVIILRCSEIELTCNYRCKNKGKDTFVIFYETNISQKSCVIEKLLIALDKR